jgi:hypothetical protein
MPRPPPLSAGASPQENSNPPPLPDFEPDTPDPAALAKPRPDGDAARPLAALPAVAEAASYPNASHRAYNTTASPYGECCECWSLRQLGVVHLIFEAAHAGPTERGRSSATLGPAGCLLWSGKSRMKHTGTHANGLTARG